MIWRWAWLWHTRHWNRFQGSLQYTRPVYSNSPTPIFIYTTVRPLSTQFWECEVKYQRFISGHMDNFNTLDYL